MVPCLKERQQSDEGVEVRQSQDGLSSGQQDKRLTRREIGPGRGQGAHIPGCGSVKEDAGFAPGDPLCQERKSAVEEGVKRMGYGEDNITIQWIGYR